MRKAATALAAGALLALGVTGIALAGAGHGSTEAEEGHTEAAGMMPGSLDEAREMHKAHEHGHDFEAMEEMSATQSIRVMALMSDIGIVMPPMDAERGRKLFAQKGCVACHSVNGVGGDLGPALNAADMPSPMNSFEFAARMWRGAGAMIALQEDLLGEAISLDGQDLADLVAFAHDAEEQAKLTEDQIPERFHSLIGE
jgi:mono/diheme cytochrome c family protein